MTYQRQMAPDDEIIVVLQELAERFAQTCLSKYEYSRDCSCRHQAENHRLGWSHGKYLPEVRHGLFGCPDLIDYLVRSTPSYIKSVVAFLKWISPAINVQCVLRIPLFAAHQASMLYPVVPLVTAVATAVPSAAALIQQWQLTGFPPCGCIHNRAPDRLPVV
jgi:hypothetical protein